VNTHGENCDIDIRKYLPKKYNFKDQISKIKQTSNKTFFILALYLAQLLVLTYLVKLADDVDSEIATNLVAVFFPVIGILLSLWSGGGKLFSP